MPHDINAHHPHTATTQHHTGLEGCSVLSCVLKQWLEPSVNLGHEAGSDLQHVCVVSLQSFTENGQPQAALADTAKAF